MSKRFKYCRKDIKQALKNGSPYVRLGKNLTALNPARVLLKYGYEGYDIDGIIEIRKDHPVYMDLGEDRQYAQVRIAVGDRFYVKGMAIYSDNVPDDYDTVVYRAYPSKLFNKLDLRKGKKVFGTEIHKYGEKFFFDKYGNKIPSPINLVAINNDWGGWTNGYNFKATSYSKKELKKFEEELDIQHRELKLPWDIKKGDQ